MGDVEVDASNALAIIFQATVVLFQAFHEIKKAIKYNEMHVARNVHVC